MEAHGARKLHSNPAELEEEFGARLHSDVGDASDRWVTSSEIFIPKATKIAPVCRQEADLPAGSSRIS